MVTVSEYQDILDDGDDDIIFTNQMFKMSQIPVLKDNIHTVYSKILSTTRGFTTVSKKSYKGNLHVMLTFKHVPDKSVGREFESGVFITDTDQYKIVEYNRYYVPEKEKYISHCIFAKSIQVKFTIDL